MNIRKIQVETTQKPYWITIGQNILREMAEYIPSDITGSKLCIVTDQNVARYHLFYVMKAAEAAGFCLTEPVIIPAGEAGKSLAAAQEVVEQLSARGLDRRSVVMALGGGVVGDVAGFAASVFMRGIPYIQVPTTLLAQADSSIGGKTGVNTTAGKNLIGTFYQPVTVLMDIALLDTLDEREFRSGYAEIVKVALVKDADFFSWLEKNDVLERAPSVVTEAIHRACAIKADIVGKDERDENGQRAMLNFGHTFGHALEAMGGYDGRLLHGEAVAVGIRLAFLFSAGCGLCSDQESVRVLTHLGKKGFLTKPPFPVDSQSMINWMRKDKKAVDGLLALILPRAIGAATIESGVREKDMVQFLMEHLSGDNRKHGIQL